MTKVYRILFDEKLANALEREARRSSQSPATLIESVLRDWLIGKGNLRIY